MNLFKNFFGKRISSNNFSQSDNQIDHWADSITTGWEYTCNLSLSTPKICLENDGLIINNTNEKPKLIGEPNKLGIDGDPYGEYGFWVRLHGYEEQFENLSNISEDMLYSRPSFVGRVPLKSVLEKDLKDFLIEFRIIVESSKTTKEKISSIKQIISKKSKENNEIYKKLVNSKKLPVNFFKDQLTNLNGVDKRIAQILWDAGYLSPEDVLNCSKSELLKINGVGNNLFYKIREK
tara:strand:- start:46 stop:750 length:705 start_codon:yes stop_codon:yes gene_type:complete